MSTRKPQRGFLERSWAEFKLQLGDPRVPIVDGDDFAVAQGPRSASLLAEIDPRDFVQDLFVMLDDTAVQIRVGNEDWIHLDARQAKAFAYEIDRLADVALAEEDERAERESVLEQDETAAE